MSVPIIIIFSFHSIPLGLPKLYFFPPNELKRKRRKKKERKDRLQQNKIACKSITNCVSNAFTYLTLASGLSPTPTTAPGTYAERVSLQKINVFTNGSDERSRYKREKRKYSPESARRKGRQVFFYQRRVTIS